MHTAFLVALLTVFFGPVMAAGPRPTCTISNKVDTTDRCESIAESSGVNVSHIMAINPNATCDPEIGVTPVCLGQTQLSCTLNATAEQTTCDTLAASFNLTTEQFVQLNDDVGDKCDDLVVGQPYCVSDAACFPGNTDHLCQGNV